MNRNFLLALCLALLGLATTACSPNRAERLAVEHLAEIDGWNAIHVSEEKGPGYDLVVLRSKIEAEGGSYAPKYYYTLERCECDSGAPKIVGDCERLARIETVKPEADAKQ